MSEPSSEQITITTISDLIDRALRVPEMHPMLDNYRAGHSAGYRHAMQDVKAIIDMNGKPPMEPVILSRS